MPFINKSPLNYPPNSENSIRIFRYGRAPTNADYKNFIIGDEWNDTSSSDFWKLVYRDATQGIWRKMAGTAAAVEFFTPDVGGQVGPDGTNNINLLGGAGIVVTGTPATNTLTIALTGGGAAIDSVTPDTGGLTGPDGAGNINFLGDSGAYLNGMHFFGDPANNTISSRDLRNITKYVVDPTALETEYQTIQAAINAANTAGIPAVVWIRPGTYTEDLVLYDGIDIMGAVSTPAGYNTTINGTHTPPDSGSISFRNLYLVDAANILNSAAAGTTTIAMVDCLIAIDDGLAINLPNWTGLIGILNCHCVGTQDGFIDIGAGAANFLCTNSTIGNGDNNIAALGGQNRIENCKWQCQMDWVGQAYGLIRDSEINNTWRISDGSIGTCVNSFFYMDVQPAIYHTSSGQVDLDHVTIESSNNPAVDGTGTISYGSVNFTNDTNTDVLMTIVAPEYLRSGPQNILSHDASVATEDVWTKYEIQGAQGYSVGIDNSDSDNFKITDGIDPSNGNVFFQITSAGVPSFPTAPLDVPSGGTGVNTITDHALIVGSGVGAVTEIGPLTNGQLPIGSTGNDPVAATLTPGSGIAIANGAGSITISATGSGLAYVEVTAATQAMAVATCYGANRGAGVTFSLPATAAAGTVMEIMGILGLWSVTQGAGQTIHIGNQVTTTGVGGSLTATNAGDCITLRCSIANTDWVIQNMMGNIAII